MAILDKLPGIEVSIHVNGAPLPEYDDDDDDDELYEAIPGLAREWKDARTVCKYIEAATDTEFSIVISSDYAFGATSPGLTCPISMDGKRLVEPILHGLLHRPIFRRHVEGINVDLPGGRGDQSLLKRFKFSKIETSRYNSLISECSSN
jgi:hypothetical protein